MKNRIYTVGYVLLITLLANLIFLMVSGKKIFLVICVVMLTALLLRAILRFIQNPPSGSKAREKLSNRQWLDANMHQLHNTYGNTWLAIADEQVLAADKSRSRLAEHISNGPYKGKDVLIYFLEL